MKTGLDLILEERERQKSKEHFDAHHDHQHNNRELAKAGMCYWGYGSAWDDEDIKEMWPWEMSWWKPKDRLRNLVRAGALFLAQSDRDGNGSCDTEVRMISRKIDYVLRLPTLDDLELSVRAYNWLKNHKIYTIEELLRHSEDELMAYSPTSNKSIKEIISSLADKKLILKHNIGPNPERSVATDAK